MSLSPEQASLYVESQGQQIHLRHIRASNVNKDAIVTPIFMVHGAIENGRIFYTESGKGLACFLAKQGFDVYVMDMRGRGKSKPTMSASSDYGQFETINQDIPACIDFIFERSRQPMHLICHSWGGVLLASLLIRHPHYLDKVRSNVCFGTKRSIYRRSFEKWFKVNLVWNRFAPMMAKRHGFFDAKRLGIGADSESKMSLDECIAWVNKGPWIDPRDGFDYGSAAEHTHWPPTWHLTGIKDLVLGYRGDVQRFIDECRNENAKFSLLSKQNGNMVDYDHNDILTHRLAVDDHFPVLLNWLKQH